MIKIEGNRVWVSFQRKVSVAQYESVDVACGATVDAEDVGEEAILSLAREVKKAHAKMVKAIQKEHGI